MNQTRELKHANLALKSQMNKDNNTVSSPTVTEDITKDLIQVSVDSSGDGENSEMLLGNCHRRDSRRAVNMKLFNVPAKTRVSSIISKRQFQKST